MWIDDWDGKPSLTILTWYPVFRWVIAWLVKKWLLAFLLLFVREMLQSHLVSLSFVEIVMPNDLTLQVCYCHLNFLFFPIQCRNGSRKMRVVPCLKPCSRLWTRWAYISDVKTTGRKRQLLWYIELVVQVVKLAECEIYSYNPDSDADPFLEKGAMWVFVLSSRPYISFVI